MCADRFDWEFDWAYLEEPRGDVVAFEGFELGDAFFYQRRQRK